ncbi:MAG: hypothetical protein OHK0039_10400 [Bacteroidia bacterium]
MVADAHGHVYAVGTRESGVFESEIITLKLGPAGNLLWEQAINNQDENEGRSIHLAPGGDIYSLGSLSNAALGLALRYDTAGNSVWTRSFQIGAQTLVADVVVDPATGDLYASAEDFDSVGVFRITAAGVLAARQAYGLEQANYIGGMALAAGTLFVAGNEGAAGQATLFGLQAGDLAETLLVEAYGLPLSDARPGAIAADGNRVWLSTFSDDGDSAVFAITQLAAGGSTRWERTHTYATIISGYPFLAHDGAGGIVGLFQNSRNVDGGQMGLVRYDDDGNQAFLTLIGSPELLTAGGLALDAAGHIFVAANDATNRRLVLSRYDPAGAQQWSITYQSPASSFPVSRPLQLRATPGGRLVLAVAHRGPGNDNDLHLMQFSASGGLLWQGDVAVQAGNTVGFAGMQVLPDGDIVIFGASTIAQYAAARFDSTGSRLWVDEGTNPFSAAPRSMAVDEQGRTYLCFSTNSHVYIRQLDAAGNLLETGEFSLPTSGTFYFPRHCAMVGGRLAILGEHLMPGNRSVPFQMLIDDQLDLVYAQVDSAETAQIQAMTVDQQGALYGAYLTGDIAMGSGQRGALVRKYGIGTVGIDPVRAMQVLRLYPNPARSLLHLELDVQQAGPYEVHLSDLQGRQLATLTRLHLPAGPAQIEVLLPPHLAAGRYLIGLSGGGRATYRPLLVGQ